MEKRKREDDGGSNGRNPKPPEDDGGALKGVLPADEEVEEFFAILKRIQAAVKYFQERRRADRQMSAAPPCWSPTFEREDFEVESSAVNQTVGLDLNSDPVSDVSD